MYRLYDNFIGIDDGVMTPGERLGAGINGLGSALLSDPVGAISGMALGVKDDLDYLMFQGGAEREPERVFGYAAGLSAPGALRGRVANVVSSSGAKPKKGIRAYHGSPHDFDRFSMDKIGTGEGAQAYGHGLYFAENEGVARSYRDALANRKYMPGDGPSPLKSAWSIVSATPERAAMATDDLVPFVRQAWPDVPDAEIRAAIDEAKSAFAPGRMYEVNINADPDDFLDWDAPLREQPGVLAKIGADTVKHDDLVSAAARANVNSIDDMMEMKGSQYYRAVQNIGSQANATRELSDGPRSFPTKDGGWNTDPMGIPGIKYRDAGSRGLDGQSGTRNFVVFDENLIEIVRKYGIAGAALALGVSAGDVQAAMDREQ